MNKFEKYLYGNLVAFMKNRPLTIQQRDKVKAVIAMLQRDFLSETKKDFEIFPGEKVPKLKIRLQLLSILGAFQKVPKDVAPDKDPGIYFHKAMEDLRDLTKKYNGEGLRCPDCGAKVNWEGHYFVCEGCDFAWDAKEFEQATYTLKGKLDYSELVLEEDLGK